MKKRFFSQIFLLSWIHSTHPTSLTAKICLVLQKFFVDAPLIVVGRYSIQIDNMYVNRASKIRWHACEKKYAPKTNNDVWFTKIL